MPSSSFVRCTRTVSVRKILYTVHSVPWVLVRLFRIRTRSRRSTKNTLLTGLKNISVSSTNWTLIKAFYSLNTASCTCTKNVTLNIQCTCPCTLKNCLLLQKKQQQKMAPSSTMCSPVTWLSCDRKCEPKRRDANKIQKKGKIKQIESNKLTTVGSYSKWQILKILRFESWEEGRRTTSMKGHYWRISTLTWTPLFQW